MLEFIANITIGLFDLLISVLTVVMDGFSFLVAIFTYIPGIIVLNFFGELPFYFQYGLYSLFCVLMFVLLIKLISLIVMK